MTQTGCHTEVMKSYRKDCEDNTPDVGGSFYCSLNKSQLDILLKGTNKNKEEFIKNINFLLA